jgi:hypothetical protein
VKRALGTLASSRYGGAYRVAKEVKICRRTIQNYSYKIKNRLVLKESGGKPKSVDTRGLQELGDYLHSHRQLKWKLLVKFMIEKQRQSWCRYRNIVYEDVSEADWPKRLSRRTILRYLHQLGYTRNQFD